MNYLVRRRKCRTCTAHNEEKALICSNCGAMLTNSKLDGPNLRIILPIAIGILIVIVVMGGVAAYRLIPPVLPTPLPVSPTMALTLPDGLGVSYVPNSKQNIGVNDGSFSPFDITQDDQGKAKTDQANKQKAADALRSGDRQKAINALTDAINYNTSDAEAKIYQENLRVTSGGQDYITLVAAVDFTPVISSSQSALQGVYTAQKEFNDKSTVKIRFLIASSAGDEKYAEKVAEQIVRIAKKEPILGVVGWQFSSHCLNAAPILAAAGIPLVAQSASTDALTGYARPYFFRVMSPNSVQAKVMAKFATAKQIKLSTGEIVGLNKQKVVLFFDPGMNYSKNIAEDFRTEFQNNGGTYLGGEYFTSKKVKAQDFSELIEHALKEYPDVDIFYFAGVVNTDAEAFQQALKKEIPKFTKLADLPIAGGDGSYVAKFDSSYGRWYFTAYAYPDEWKSITQVNNRIAPHGFFDNYKKNFDPRGTHHGYYGFDRPDSRAILSYDAATALLQARQEALKLKDAITSRDIANALPHVQFQGVSGYIILTDTGDPRDKPILILAVSSDAHIKMLCISEGTFYPGADQSRLSCPA